MKKGALTLLLLALLAALCGCTSQPQSYAVEGGIYVPGTYTATANGNIGPLTVETVFSSDAIASVRVVYHEETGVLSEPAIERIPAQIVDNQTLAVDILSGATHTSHAIVEAVTQCVRQAGYDPRYLNTPVLPSDKAQQVKLKTDVVVVGAGLSGMCAAVSAAQNGAHVLIIEKLAYIGGSATSSLGSFVAVQRMEGLTGDLQEMSTQQQVRHWCSFMRKGRSDGIYPDTQRLSAMLDMTPQTICWLMDMGAEFSFAGLVEGFVAKIRVDVPGKTQNKPAGRLIALLEERARAYGATILTDVTATHLIQDDAAVIGVIGESESRQYEIHADSVILACGGYASSREMIKALAPEIDEAGYYCQSVSANMGDGIRMAQEAGAACFEDNWVIPSYISPSETLIKHDSRFLKLIDENGLENPDPPNDQLMVNRRGERFHNEAGGYSIQNIAMVNEKAYPYYALYDCPPQNIAEILETGISTGEVFKGDTLQALARAAGMDSDVLEATAARYSALAQAKEDDDFGKDPAFMKPIAAQGPYYLVHMVCCFTGTLGGVKTNSHFQAVREDGSTICGLYAVGEMANRLYYDRMYISGSSLTFSATMGMVAGRNTAVSAAEDTP